ncbi:MAG: RagB/SusD family nutrient uptake outer membrane protein [Bacteroidales bacterium]|nr:MAG: RagB/SusD family nutrient uptake outer membrane protein [Bacteroidales bacterium]
MKNLIIVALLLVLFSCDKYLDLEPENDLIRQEFWQTKDDVDAVMAAMYDAFRETSLESLIWGELRADMIILGGNDFADYVRIAESDISPTNGAIKWNEYYFAINLANTLIEYSGDVLGKDDKFTEQLKLSYDAEAMFVRAMCYFYLVRVWKDVPLIVKASTSDTVNFYVPKSTEYEVLNFLIEDLKYAETIAYDLQNISDPVTFKGRANLYSIRAVLANIYLWLERYNECLEYCEKIISSGIYSLLSEENWFLLYYPGNSLESIYEIQYNDGYNYEENPIYEKFLPLSGFSAAYPSIIAQTLFDDEDIRLCAGNPWNKYLRKSITSSLFRDNTERDANFIYYRYSEILLMKSECLAETGNLKEAYQQLNEVVNRAGVGSVESTESIYQFRESLLSERAKEYAMEGKRWFDVLRFAKKEKFADKNKITSIILSKFTNPNDLERLKARIKDTMFYYLPIPQGDLDVNKALVQNPFYDR